MSRLRIGQGLDAHQLIEGKPLMLGGIQVPYERGLEGHSDGDALLHAIASAILGALGEGDLGTHFPSSDPGLKGIASAKILETVCTMMRETGYVINNLDATIVAQQPRLASYLMEMKSHIAVLLGAEEAHINIKCTSTDEMGALGRAEGIFASAVVLLVDE